MSRPRLLDLFCGAGGSGVGYHRAGFDVVGVDHVYQKRYPFEFHQGDALEFLTEYGREFDAIHVSPPCQAHTALKTMPNAHEHPDLIPQTRESLYSIGKPFIIENVAGAPLRFAARLCGTSFGLGIGDAELRRHRYFETNWPLLCPPCEHGIRANRCISIMGGHGRDRKQEHILATVTVTGHGGEDRRYATYRPQTRSVAVGGHTTGHSTRSGRRLFSIKECREAMGIDWMTQAELSQAIPPSYSEYIGRRLLEWMACVG